MPDMLIRDVPAEDLARLDEIAKRLGVSRIQFVRSQLLAVARRADTPVTVADLAALADVAADLDDENVMARAWS